MKYVGVDIGGTNLKAGLTDESGQLLAVQKMKVAAITDQQSLAWTIVSLTQELAKCAGVPLNEIASVGVGVPGTVEIRSGSIGYTCNLPLQNVPLRKLFHHYLSIPLYIENDANCAALAEYYAGAGRESKRFVTITLGTGVGAGIIHNGKVYHGANGMAGEVGHTVIVKDGLPCPCGRRGCWEQYASTTALVRGAHAIDPNLKDGRAIFAAAEAGNPLVLDLIDRWTDEIAQGLAGMVHIFNPQLILIGGGVSAQEKFLIEPVAAKVRRSIMPAFAEGLEIRAAQLHNDAGMVGAVYYFRQTMENT